MLVSARLPADLSPRTQGCRHSSPSSPLPAPSRHSTRGRAWRTVTKKERRVVAAPLSLTSPLSSAVASSFRLFVAALSLSLSYPGSPPHRVAWFLPSSSSSLYLRCVTFSRSFSSTRHKPRRRVCVCVYAVGVSLLDHQLITRSTSLLLLLLRSASFSFALSRLFACGALGSPHPSPSPLHLDREARRAGATGGDAAAAPARISAFFFALFFPLLRGWVRLRHKKKPEASSANGTIATAHHECPLVCPVRLAPRTLALASLLSPFISRNLTLCVFSASQKPCASAVPRSDVTSTSGTLRVFFELCLCVCGGGTQPRCTRGAVEQARGKTSGGCTDYTKRPESSIAVTREGAEVHAVRFSGVVCDWEEVLLRVLSELTCWRALQTHQRHRLGGVLVLLCL